MTGARVLLLACVVWLAFAGGAAQAAPGDVDGSFSRDGLLALDHAISSFAGTPDGGVLTLGTRRQKLTVTKYSARGQLDRSFGVRGRTRIPGPADAEGKVISADIAVDTDGTAVVAGFVTTGEDPSTWFFVRLRPDGSLEPSFGAGGMAAATIPAYQLESIALDSQRRIVAAGSRSGSLSRGTDIVRLLPNGELDSSFSSDGMQYVNTLSADAVATADGFVLATGYPILIHGVTRTWESSACAPTASSTPALAKTDSQRRPRGSTARFGQSASPWPSIPASGRWSAWTDSESTSVPARSASATARWSPCAPTAPMISTSATRAR